MARISLELVESNAEIEKKIKQALLRDVDKAMAVAVNKSVTPIRNLVKNKLMEQPEVQSLQGGQLAGEFGLPDGARRIEDIINFWVSNIIVSKKKATASGGRLNAGLSIRLIQRDFEDVLSLNSATVITEKGEELPWLEWLLKFGDRVIIRDYDVYFSKSRRSRSGLAIMINNKRSWGVPPQFSGTIENNFVTRALESIEDDIVNILQKQVEMSV